MGIIVGNGIVFEHGAYRKLSEEERVKNVKAEDAADGVKETEKAEEKNISPKAVIDGSQIVIGKDKKDTKKGSTKKDK